MIFFPPSPESDSGIFFFLLSLSMLRISSRLYGTERLNFRANQIGGRNPGSLSFNLCDSEHVVQCLRTLIATCKRQRVGMSRG